MVDASLRATIIDSLYRLYREMGISFVYITHDLTTAYQVSDELIVLYRGMVVEAGDAETVIRTPSHPYARELIRAIPSTETGTDWISGTGRATDAVAAGPAIAKADTGCPYADRCPEVMDRCRRERPGLLQTAPDVRTACFRYDTQRD
jgi:peptide/nickel transport system ATP-binding protein